MKTTPLSSLPSLLFLVFAITTTTIAAAEMVYDSSGNPMLNGGTYVATPTLRYSGAKIFDAAIIHDDDTCSLAVILGGHELPVTITALQKPTYITTSLTLFISFARIQPNVCTNNSNWIVQRPLTNEFAETFFPVMVGDSDNPLGSFFHIRPYESTTKKYTYKLVFCDGGICRNIGVHVDNHGYKRLVVTTGEPLALQFDKVDKKRSFAYEISMVV